MRTLRSSARRVRTSFDGPEPGPDILQLGTDRSQLGPAYPEIGTDRPEIGTAGAEIAEEGPSSARIVQRPARIVRNPARAVRSPARTVQRSGRTGLNASNYPANPFSERILLASPGRHSQDSPVYHLGAWPSGPNQPRSFNVSTNFPLS